MTVLDEGGKYKDLVQKDADNFSVLKQEEIARSFDVKYYLRNVEKAFTRVFA
jgi:adenylosuccinate lyase